MNNQRFFTPGRILLYTCLLLSLILLVLMAGVFQRRSAASRLKADQVQLASNFNTRRELDQDTISDLENQIREVRNQINTLEGSFPDLEINYDMFARIKVLADIQEVDLIRVQDEGTSLQSFPNGDLKISSYAVEINGPIAGCINLLAALEADSRGSSDLSQAALNATDQVCVFKFIVAGPAP
jgi:TolA-binding protein